MDVVSIKDTLFAIQHGLCACCGGKMIVSKNDSPQNASIQYIDPYKKMKRLGYIELVHQKCQRGWGGSRDKPEMSTERKKKISKKLLEIFGNRCCFCGESMELDKINHRKSLSIEHIVPRSLGGTDDLNNLLLAHRDCNSRHENYSVTKYVYNWE